MSKRTKEYIISVDIEADGPCPLLNSMLQFGAVFYDLDGNVIFEYSANIEPLDGATQDPDTMKWWTEQEVKNPGLWASMMVDRMSPLLAMQQFDSHVRRISKELNASPLVVAYPAGYDFTWTYVYLCKFVGKSVVGFSALDMKTLAMTLIQRTYHDSSKARFPRKWSNSIYKHTHNALDDARGQGYMFWQMMESLKNVWEVLGQSGNEWANLTTVEGKDFR